MPPTPRENSVTPATRVHALSPARDRDREDREPGGRGGSDPPPPRPLDESDDRSHSGRTGPLGFAHYNGERVVETSGLSLVELVRSGSPAGRVSDTSEARSRASAGEACAGWRRR